MTTQTLPFRALALAGAVWVQLTLAGPGLHDPDCPHHLPGAPGPAHHGVGHGTLGEREAAGDTEHAHTTHAPHGAPASGGASTEPAPPTDADSDAPPDECRCLGVCVPGTPTGAPSLRNDLPEALLASPARAAAPEAVFQSAPAPRTHRLPPATGPPLPA